MKAPRFVQIPTLFALAALALVSAPRPAQAVPYACNLTNGGTFITFRLNESADSVKIVSNGGATTNDLGALDAGLHTPALSIAGNFQVVVSKVSGLGYLQGVFNQIGSDTNLLLRFVNQRGVAVNKNPASPYFGRIYVSVSQSGVNTASGRSLGDGIYLLNADQTDAVGQGDTARTAGLDFQNPSPNAESPNRLTVGPDDNLYIADWSDTSGSLYVTDPDVITGQNVFAGPTGSAFPLTSASGKIHGSINAAHIEGSLAGGNLTVWVIDEDLQTDKDSTTRNQQNSIWRWEIGAGPLPTSVTPARVSSAGITFASVLADLVRGPDGKWYKSQRRAEPASPSSSSANIFVITNDGSVVLWDSLTATRTYLNDPGVTDLVNETCALDVSPDGKVLAALRRDTNSVSIFPLRDGLPNMTNRVVLTNLPSTGLGRDLAFDIAGNLYTVSSGHGLLRILSPGGPTTTISGSDGTFTLIRPPSVSVVTTTNVAYEAGPVAGAFSIVRTGNLADPVTVFYTLSGTATNGTDYVTNVLSATIPAGESSVDVLITPISDGVAELVENVRITLIPGTLYDVTLPVTASLDIVDDQQPNVIDINVTDASAVERFGGTDGLRYVLTRRGDTNLELFVAVSTTSGTATPGFDFQDLPGAIVFAPGVVTVTNDVLVVDDGDVEGNETVVVKVEPGVDPYVPGTPDTATGVILDDEEPAACVLFSDNFEADTSAAWTERFGATNGILDRTLFWNYDYSLLGIPPAPRSTGGTTRGLYVTVNKDTLWSSAGVNLYPNGQSFSGNYALRFDLYLNIGNSNQTEHALAGLNHSGAQTNWVSQNPANHVNSRGNDGVFVAINSSGGNLGDYAAYTATNTASVPGQLTNRPATTLTSIFPSPPYAFAGSIGCASNAATKVWSQVELRQINGRVNLLINNYTVLDLTNSTPYTSGNVMIGYNDQFSSRGSDLNFAIFDNVRVVQLDFQIKSIELLPGNQVQIDFVSPILVPKLSELQLFSAPDLNSPASFVQDAGAVFSAIPEGWRAVTTRNGANRFYQVRIQQ